ncbi:MAG: 4Fe-4S binding protein [Bradymonadaceae bacterium]|nr:4Fe-4S binding protein [Lujinxingiaceae bacterium]
MSDKPDLSRRGFLRGDFLGRATARPAAKKPVYVAMVAVDGEDIEAERKRARATLGKIREPEAKPFDVLALLAGYDANPTPFGALADDEHDDADQESAQLVASIQPYACLAHMGSFCTVCSERCPQPGAIELVNHRPRVNASLCSGCGVCEPMCPAPGGAIVMSRASLDAVER